MKKWLAIFFLLVLVPAGVWAGYQGASQAQPAKPAAAPAHLTVSVNDLKWTPLFLGLETAVVSGDPAKVGAPFVMRVRATKAAAVPAHWHPLDENVTVLTGVFKVGMSEKYDEKALRALPAGAYTFIPKNMRHYAWHAPNSVIQVHGMGPFAITFVNPADDPRTAKTK